MTENERISIELRVNPGRCPFCGSVNIVYSDSPKLEGEYHHPGDRLFSMKGYCICGKFWKTNLKVVSGEEL